MAAIERFIGKAIDRVKLEGFNYTYTTLFDDPKDKKPGGGGGGFPGKARGVRLSGGYFFGPARRKRR